MDVRFTQLAGRRYTITVMRERGPELAPRQGPGYDDHLPHDAVHLVVEREARLAGGVWGRVADGWSTIFWPADPALVRRQARREARRVVTPAQRADMARSEHLASITPPLWERRVGRRRELPAWMDDVPPEELASPVVRRIVDRLDDLAASWNALRAGEGITLSWP